MLAALANVPLIFFVQVDVEDGPIRLGHSVDLPIRFADIEVECPYPVRLVGVEKCESRREAVVLENSLHSDFRKHRLHHAWYRPASVITNYIAQHCMDAAALGESIVAENTPISLPSRLLTAAQVAQQLGIKKEELLRLAHERVVPFVRVGRHFRFVAEPVRKALACYRRW